MWNAQSEKKTKHEFLQINYAKYMIISRKAASQMALFVTNGAYETVITYSRKYKSWVQFTFF